MPAIVGGRDGPALALRPAVLTLLRAGEQR